MASRVITPEAVLLELPTAGVATRAFARLVDQVFFTFLAAVLAFAVGTVFHSEVLLAVVISFVYLLVLPIGSEILWKGQSLGKLIFSLRVVGVDGSPIRPRQAFIRGLVGMVDIYLSIGFLAVITSLMSPSSQRSGDMAAGTVVIRTRAAGKRLTPIAFHAPLGFETYVATLDVGRLDDTDFTLIREFLLRVKEFSPAARSDLAMELANSILSKTEHVLPGVIDPELWLVCVASAYQSRQGGLLADAALGLAPLAARW